MNNPNVMLIVLDTLRADIAYSMIERDELTALNKFSEGGTIFKNAYSTAPWTLPSHASIFTGQRSSTHETHAGHKQFEPKVPTLASTLSDQGYQTAAISGNSWVSPQFGFNDGFDSFSMKWERLWGGADLTPVVQSTGLEKARKMLEAGLSRDGLVGILNAIYAKTVANRSDWGAKLTTDRTIKWIDSHSYSTPFFFFINYLEPHLPYDPPADFRERFVDGDEYRSVNQNPWKYNAGGLSMDEKDFEILRSLYKAEISYLDFHLNRLYDYLDNSDMLESTAIFIVGDHGENIGDHDLMDHQYSLHDSLLHVPMIAHYPPEFTTDNESGLIELRDLYPTITKLAGGNPNGEGVSTINIIEDSRKVVCAEYRYPQPDMDSLAQEVDKLQSGYKRFDRTIRSIRNEDWRLIEYEDGEKKLLRTTDDDTDLSKKHPTIVKELIQIMNQEGLKIRRPSRQTSSIDPASKDRLEDLGYI